MTRFRLTIAALALLILALAGTYAVIASRPEPVQPISVDVASPEALSADERRFYRAVAPELRAAAGEARELTTMGEERSRNLLAIQAGQARLEAHLQTLDELVSESEVPARFTGIIEDYGSAAATIREAMGEAQAGFLRFDWDRVGAATELMATGTGQLEAAAGDLDRAAGMTPATEG